MDKGLSGSRWHPRNTGQAPYQFNKRSTTCAITNPASPNTAALASCTATDTTLSTQLPTNVRPPAAEDDATPSPDAAYPPSGSASQLDLNAALRRIPTPWAELARYTKIVRRLKWKLPFLAHAYNAATDHVYGTDEQREEAELMFKLDFFEYYMLLERALVHLLGVFGIKVTGGLGGRRAIGNAGRQRGDEGRWEQSDHRFHANVLEAFRDPINPLHQALGKDVVCFALSRAKECESRTRNVPLGTANGMLLTRCL